MDFDVRICKDCMDRVTLNTIKLLLLLYIIIHSQKINYFKVLNYQE